MRMLGSAAYLVQIGKLLRIVTDVKVCHSFSTSVLYGGNVKSQCCLLLSVKASKVYLLLLPDVSLQEIDSWSTPDAMQSSCDIRRL